MEYKTCKKCGENKPLTIDYFAQGTNKRNGIKTPYWYNKCKLCDRSRSSANAQIYKEKNRLKLAAAQREYHLANKENDSNTKKKWYILNKDSVLLRVKRNIYSRRETDILFILKEIVSYRVSRALNKNGKSVLKYLPYSIEKLKEHLEKLFEPWMTWENYGKYSVKTWDDNDTATWKWNIDHIIPHSTFKYSYMEDQAFIDCWALANLRPYSAKQNIIDGART